MKINVYGANKMNLDERIELFKEKVMDCGYVLDSHGQHSEFVSGMHGQKLDFDNITGEDPLYGDWVDINASYIKESYSNLPEILIGVANGTNRLAVDVASKFGDKVLGLVSAKDSKNSKKLYLPEETEVVLKVSQPKLVVVVEDVGTTGSNSEQVASTAAKYTDKVEVLITWQRREALERLKAENISYRSIIRHILPTFTPDECQSDPGGFCAMGWDLKTRQ